MFLNKRSSFLCECCCLLVFTLCLVFYLVKNNPNPNTECNHELGHTTLESGVWSFENPEIPQDDENLLKYIEKYHLLPPSTKPYISHVVTLNDPSPLSALIAAIFKGKRNGFFIEAGAFNGVQESNSLILERDFGWTGLLVEGNSFLLPELRLVNRKAWIADVCLALEAYPQKIEFTHHPGETSAGMIKYSGLGSNPSNANMQKFNYKRKDKFVSAGFVECFPVYSILRAMNITTVDYFSLDVEGAELKILSNIPFDRVTIKVLSVEYWIVRGGVPALDEFMISKNYKRLAEEHEKSDVFYVRNDFLEEFNLNGFKFED